MKFLGYLLLERNILNMKFLDKFVQDFCNEIENDAAMNHADDAILIKWAKSNLRNYLIREYPNVKKVDSKRIAGFHSVNAQEPWIQKAIDRGDELFEIIISGALYTQLHHIKDYFRANPNLNLSRISVPEAIRQSEEWTRNLNKKASLEEDLKGIELIRKYSSGFHWVKVTSKQSLDREGAIMRHCVGSYYDKVSSGQSVIYSLRDKGNEPHCTIEVVNNTIKQIKGKANGAVDKKYISYVKNFLFKPPTKMEISTYDLQNVGLMLVNDKVYDPENLPEDEGEFVEFAKHMTGDKDFWEKSKYYPRFLDILKKNVIFVDGKHKVVYKGEEIKVGLGMLRQLELDISPKLALSILDILPKPKINSTNFRVYFPFTNVDKNRDALYRLQRLIRLKPDLKEKIKNHPWIKVLNLEVNTFIEKHILPITYANLDDLLTKKTAQNWYSVPEFFRESLRTINEVIWALPEVEETKIRKTVFSHFYNDFVPRGPMTPERENGLRVWKDIVQNVFDFLKSDDRYYW